MNVWFGAVCCLPDGLIVLSTGLAVTLAGLETSVGKPALCCFAASPTLIGAPRGTSALLPLAACLRSALHLYSSLLPYASTTRRIHAGDSPYVSCRLRSLSRSASSKGSLTYIYEHSSWWGGGMVPYFHHPFNYFSILFAYCMLGSAPALAFARLATAA